MRAIPSSLVQIKEPDALRRRLLGWFRRHKRALPWRDQRHWYTTWLSEIILQQTTVEQGLPYFEKFIRRFPDVHSLAHARQQEVLRLWQGLGYYARARHLHKTAVILVEQHNGCFPSDYKTALSLPGIGPYTAAAILSQVYGTPHAVVDGNVTRVISRLFNMTDDIRKAAAARAIKNTAQLLLDEENAGDFNEAMMELGATVCTPKTPKCTACPVQEWCLAEKKGVAEKLPFKSPPPAKKKWFHWVLVYKNGNRYLLRQRPEKGLLARLWEFPFLETTARQLRIDPHKLAVFSEYNVVDATDVMRHEYSHIRLHYRAVLIGNTPHAEKHYTAHWIDADSFVEYPLHTAHKRVVEWALQR